MRTIASLVSLYPLYLAVAVSLVLCPQARAETLDQNQTIERALARHPSLAVSQADVAISEARVREMRAVFYPKLRSLMFAAPMYTIEGNAMQVDVTRKYNRLKDWGPWLHFEASLIQPLYTFGQAENGKKAAKAAVHLEQARLAAVQHAVRQDVSRLYATLLFARTMQKPLQSAIRQLDEALQQAQAWYAEGNGKVLQSDLQRLAYGKAELQGYALEASHGAATAADGLRFMVGAGPEADLHFSGTRLPRAATALTETSLAHWFQVASQHRPEWAQLQHGRSASLSKAQAEKLASAPVLFLGAQIKGDWAPTVENTPNPFHNDAYNQLEGGVALGLQFDTDIGRSRARGQAAEAEAMKIEAMGQFAESGIPTEVSQAWRTLQHSHRRLQVTAQARKAARKWLAFSANAFQTGTGEARDVLEALVAWLQARRGDAEALLAWHLAVADLSKATGKPLQSSR